MKIICDGEVKYLVDDDFRGLVKLTHEYDNKVMFLSGLTVDVLDRCSGVGAALLLECEKIAHSCGCKCVSLEVDKSEGNAGWLINWYGVKGYTCVGYGYYENRILMSKILN